MYWPLADVAVPECCSVAEYQYFTVGPVMLKKLPDGRVTLPVRFTVPPLQANVPLMVTALVPPNVPFDMVRLVIVNDAVLLRLSAPPLMVTAPSAVTVLFVLRLSVPLLAVSVP